MSDAVQVDVIDDIKALRCQRDAWDAVYQADPQAHIFLSWIWLTNWLDLVSEPWMVLAARQKKEDAPYCAFFPVQLWSERDQGPGFINTVRMGGTLLAGYSGVLCDPRFEADVVPALTRRLLDFNWAGLYLTSTRMSEERYALLVTGFEPSSFRVIQQPPLIDENGIDKSVNCYVELPADWETFLSQNLGSKMRAHARRYMRHLESGELRVTHTTAETLGGDLDTLYRFWEDRWGSIKSDQNLAYSVRYGRTMIERCFREDAVLIMTLWHGEEPVGVQMKYLDFVNKTIICNIDGRDLNFRRPSPGLVLHFYAIRWAIENGYQTYDLQLGSDAYKYDLGAIDRRLANTIIATRNNKNRRDRLDPRSLDSVLLLSQHAAATGDFDNAKVGCTQILQVDPKHAGARDLLSKVDDALAATIKKRIIEAQQLVRQGAIDQAIGVFEDVLAAEPKNYDARLMVGLVYLHQGNATAAEKHIRQALVINAKAAPAHFNYGMALRGLGRGAKALKSFKKAISLKPDYVEAHNASGEVLASTGRHAEALKCFDKAISLQPGFAPARQNRDRVAPLVKRQR